LNTPRENSEPSLLKPISELPRATEPAAAPNCAK